MKHTYALYYHDHSIGGFTWYDGENFTLDKVHRVRYQSEVIAQNVKRQLATKLSKKFISQVHIVKEPQRSAF